MKRWLFNIVTVVSLLLCTAFAALWCRSHDALEMFQYQGRTWVLSVQSEPGLIGLIAWRNPTKAPGFVHETRPLDSGDWAKMIDLCVALWGGRAKGPFAYCLRGPIFAALAPAWFFTALTGLLPAAWLGRFIYRIQRPHRRIQRGLCLKCGYDLRASKDRCPECGTPIPAGVVKEPSR